MQLLEHAIGGVKLGVVTRAMLTQSVLFMRRVGSTVCRMTLVIKTPQG